MNITSPKFKLHPKTFKGFKKTSEHYKKLKKYLGKYFSCKKGDYSDKYISIEVYVYIDKNKVCVSDLIYNSCVKPVITALVEDKIIDEAKINSIKVTRVRIGAASGEGVLVKLAKCPGMECSENSPGAACGCKNYIPFG